LIKDRKQQSGEKQPDRHLQLDGFCSNT